MILEKGNGYVPEFFLPTPSLLLNAKLHKGGGPSGVIMQFQSEKPGSFKSSMALQMLGYAQTKGLNTAYIDGEGA
jgi:RecA/RadA recombinase